MSIMSLTIIGFVVFILSACLIADFMGELFKHRERMAKIAKGIDPDESKKHTERSDS